MSTPSAFDLIGNNVAADFVNTRFSPAHPEGSIRNWRDVIAFLSAVDAIASADAAGVRAAVAERPATGNRLTARALALREAIRAGFLALDQGRRAPPEAVAEINAVLSTDAGYDRLEPRGAGHVLAFYRTRSDPVALLAPIARAAAELIATDDPRVRKCANRECVRYFHDTSRTGRRRWCDMAVCGNRAKAAAFVRRRRENSGESGRL